MRRPLVEPSLPTIPVSTKRGAGSLSLLEPASCPALLAASSILAESPAPFLFGSAASPSSRRSVGTAPKLVYICLQGHLPSVGCIGGIDLHIPMITPATSEAISPKRASVICRARNARIGSMVTSSRPDRAIRSASRSTSSCSRAKVVAGRTSW